jgi:hypothetical protein
MSTLAYNSKSVPGGGFIVQIYRDQNNPMLLGTYIVETVNPTASDVMVKRPNELGGRNGFRIAEGDREGSVTIQLALATTPTTKSGDFFTLSTRVDTNGVPINERFVLHNVGEIYEMNGYARQNASVIVDADVA